MSGKRKKSAEYKQQEDVENAVLLHMLNTQPQPHKLNSENDSKVSSEQPSKSERAS